LTRTPIAKQTETFVVNVTLPQSTATAFKLACIEEGGKSRVVRAALLDWLASRGPASARKMSPVVKKDYRAPVSVVFDPACRPPEENVPEEF